jgi:hypothetical protein
MTLACGLAALLALAGYGYVFEYRPWEAHYRLRPTSWWAGEISCWVDVSDSAFPPSYFAPLTPWEQWQLRLGVSSDEHSHRRFRLLQGDPEAVPVLAELLRWPDPVVRLRAAGGLWWFRGDARLATPALMAALGDPNDRVREAAREALRHTDPEALAAYDRDHPGAGPQGGSAPGQ